MVVCIEGARGTIALHDDVTAPQFPGLFKTGVGRLQFIK
jgi:hypothetical protein